MGSGIRHAKASRGHFLYAGDKLARCDAFLHARREVKGDPQFMDEVRKAPPQRQAGGLHYAVDENPPHALAAMMGFQVVALIITGIALTPLLVLRVAGAEAELGSWVVFAALLISGISTILQAVRIGPLGSGYVLFMGTSGAFIAVSIAAITAGGLPLLAALVVFSSFFQFFLATRLGLLRRILTPTVGGTAIMLIAVTVFPVVFDLLTVAPEDTALGSAGSALVAIGTFVITIAVLLFGKGFLKLWGPLAGVIGGCLLAWAAGHLDLAPVAEAQWFGLPRAGWPGLDLSFGPAFWALLPAFVIVTLVGAIETYGDGIAIQRLSHREERPLDFKVVQGAVLSDGLGNLLSGLAGTMPNTTYSDSLSVVQMTGVAARKVGLYGGVILACLAFSPKLSMLLQSVPSPVMGAFAFVTLALLFGHGLRMVTDGGLSYRNGFVVCIAFWLGAGFQSQALFADLLPAWSRVILDNGMTAGTLAALVMMMILNLSAPPRRRRSFRGSRAALREMHDWLQEQSLALGWDKPAIMRLQLAAEEAMLYLIERASSNRKRGADRLSVAFQQNEGQVRLEFFIGAQTSENILGELSTLQPQPQDLSGEDAGLRILRGLVQSLDHQQYYEGEYLSFSVDSRPLT